MIEFYFSLAFIGLFEEFHLLFWRTGVRRKRGSDERPGDEALVGEPAVAAASGWRTSWTVVAREFREKEDSAKPLNRIAAAFDIERATIS